MQERSIDQRPAQRPARRPRHAPTPGTVLQVGSLPRALTAQLAADFRALRLPRATSFTEPAIQEFLAEHAEGVRVIATSGFFGASAELMDALPKLEAIVNLGVGYDSTDVEHARELGVGLSNTPDVLNDCVADTAVGLVIDTVRGFSAADRYVRAGRWETDGDFPLTRKVTGARVGILGLGRIGKAIAHRLEAFDCEISYHNRRPVEGVRYPYRESARELAAGVQVLIVATPGGAGSQKLVDAEVLAALGHEGYVINIARGSVIDEVALVDAVTSGRLAGAGLDVFVDEPRVPEALRRADNVVILPHAGSATEETRADMEALVIENLAEYLDNGRFITPVLEPVRGR